MEEQPLEEKPLNEQPKSKPKFTMGYPVLIGMVVIFIGIVGCVLQFGRWTLGCQPPEKFLPRYFETPVADMQRIVGYSGGWLDWHCQASFYSTLPVALKKPQDYRKCDLSLDPSKPDHGIPEWEYFAPAFPGDKDAFANAAELEVWQKYNGSGVQSTLLHNTRTNQYFFVYDED